MSARAHRPAYSGTTTRTTRSPSEAASNYSHLFYNLAKGQNEQNTSQGCPTHANRSISPRSDRQTPPSDIQERYVFPRRGAGLHTRDLRACPTRPKHADMLTHHCPGYRERLSSGSRPNLNIFASPQPPSGSPQHTPAHARQSAPKSAPRRHRLRQQPQQSCGSPAAPSQSWSCRKVAARGRTCTSAVHDSNAPR
jgi:hypothetical protein